MNAWTNPPDPAAERPRLPLPTNPTRWLIATLVLLGVLFAAALGYLGADGPGQHLRLDQVRSLVAQGRVLDGTLRDQDSRLVGHLKPVRTGAAPGQSLPTASAAFWTALPSSGAVTAALVDSLQTSGAEVTVDSQPTKQKVRTIATFLLPLLIFANLLALLLSPRGGTSAIGEVMTFGSMGRRRVGPDGSKRVSFADVAGCNEAVAELAEVRDYLTNPARYAALGATPPKGVLLFGPPGCGKTLLGRAVAGEAGVPFFSVAGAEFVESLVGVGAARIRDLFARVRAEAPAIVFIDELDAAGRRRGVGGGTGGSDEREQTLNQLLVEMDGFAAGSGIVVIGATNRPDILDPALLRPGRFDRHVTIDAPDVDGRARILQIHSRRKPLHVGFDVVALARRTPGFTGADLANVINDAALLAARADERTISSHHVDEAVARVLHGPQRRGRVITADERRRLLRHLPQPRNLPDSR